MKTLFVVAMLLLIVYNLGAALYYMVVDHGTTDRTVNALTRRIGLSVLLILLVAAGLVSGVIPGHDNPY
jgi:small neutral amino acid transporter SnatA (MarC family)